MNIDELWQQITAAGREHDYALRSVAMPEHQPSSVTVVEPAADDTGRWVMYFSERGQIIDPQYYPDEDSACQAALRRLDRPDNPKHTLTESEQQVAAERNSEAEQLRRRMLADLGIDPDTGASAG